MGRADAAGLVAGYVLDAIVGDPRRWHPVAGFGTLAGKLERKIYAPERRAGALFAGLAVGVPAAAGYVAVRATRDRPIARAAVTAVATWTVLGGRTLRKESRVMAAHLERGDLPAARGRLSHLCGRNPEGLDEPELARATVESVAENTSDAVVAPLVWGAILGIPGLLGYRAANTLDAMVGHRNSRYARFGTPAARLDDVLNLVPSRLTGLLTIAAARTAGGDPRETKRVWLRDRNDHPSPNAGQCESAMAGALGVRLGGRNVYFGRSETRPLLGDGPRPKAGDLRRAARLSGVVGALALGIAAITATAKRSAKAQATATAKRSAKAQATVSAKRSARAQAPASARKSAKPRVAGAATR
ncbi:cobalamin biosynthesis protein [Actinoplanes sp. NPDC051411]|uniref:cobalamin biosynthesis protein n=1 Tax=Actinoplanes sp. NPDC051411 TaxID=3155522 RepID=UPI0034489E9D